MFASSANASAKQLRSAEQRVVADELRNFEATHLYTAVTPARLSHASRSALSDSTETTIALSARPAAALSSANVNAGSAAQANQKEQTLKLMQPPFSGSAVHGERTALGEAQQVHDAVAWLRECPSDTLRQLQKRVLCGTETLFKHLVGMPAAARELLEMSADPNEERDRVNEGSAESLEAEEHAAEVYVAPPPPLTFTEFLSTFLRDASATSSAASFYGVLLSGRPQPAAPLSSLHLVYGLHVVEDVLRHPTASPSSGSSKPPATAMTTGLEGHQALLSQIVHWAHFFESIFDKAREGLCRDPINFYVAVLLACAERWSWEMHNTPEVIAEEAVRRLCLDDGLSGRRPDICSACKAEATYLAERCRTYVRHTLRAMQYSEGRTSSKGKSASSPTASGSCSHCSRHSGAAQTRFFLSTPAVVWWAAAFLRLYRLRTPVAATTLTTASSSGSANKSMQLARTSADDVISSSEAYFIRDWIARTARMDLDGFAVQEREGSFAIPLSCATTTPVAVFCFTQENVQAALRKISEWVDAGIATDTPLRVQQLLGFLQDDFPVLPYYLSFFAPD
ncbi:hypothetical protein ABL78_6200 [Leptomonas seymouri]|uniref:Uncharacterized protein n=1 Tax=Leptomonas seymouri TaxID=5684 RepID=A0A0N1IJ42_LEPSE|nr:hypothetical protein ABL78_6200 [Leptomonas seymouri]|eukprot:KPI84755.1 hypothetical protein ABL78_6200 [Leptomonas seymouri]